MIRNLPNGFKQTLLYGSSVAMMRGISLLMLPFVAHQLSPEEFGRLEVISTLAVIGSVLAGMGLEDTLFRFAGSAKTALQRQRAAAGIFGLAMLLGAAFWTIGWVAAETIAGYMPAGITAYEVQLVWSVLALEGCIAIPLGWLRMRDRAMAFFLLTSGRAVTHALLVIIFLSLDRGVTGVLEAGLLATVAQALLLGVIHIRDVGFSLSRDKGLQSLIYSLPIVFSGILAFALNGLDRWILTEYASLTDVAQFAIAAKFALAVVLLLQPFGMWWSPRRFTVLNEIGGEEKVACFISLGIALTLVATIIVGLSAPLLIHWLLPESYAEAARYAVGLAVVMAFKELGELLNIGCFTGRTTGMQLLINAIAAVAGITAMFYWTPLWAVWGIIAALLLAQALRFILFYCVSQHYLPLPYPRYSLALVALISFSSLALGLQVNTPVSQLLIMLAGTGVLFAVTIQLRIIPWHHFKKETSS